MTIRLEGNLGRIALVAGTLLLLSLWAAPEPHAYDLASPPGDSVMAGPVATTAATSPPIR